MWSIFERGGPVMWPLLVCSLLSLTVTIERIIFWWRERRRANAHLIDHIFRCTEHALYGDVVTPDMPPTDAAVRVLLSGLAHRRYGLNESMAAAAGEEVDRMKRGLPILDTIITLAPLLGILGTVTGIIRSFDMLGGNFLGDPRDVIGGIAEALITTAAGLVVALVTLIPFNYFVARVERAARVLEQIMAQMEIAYKRGVSDAPEHRV